MNDERGMSLIVKTITRLTAGFMLLFGVYIALHGHISPGGGFIGGLIGALAFVCIMLAFGKEYTFRKINQNIVSIFESIGVILFLGIAVLGIIGGYVFFNFLLKGRPFTLFSSGFIPLSNIVIGLEVFAGIFSIVLILVLLDISKKVKEK